MDRDERDDATILADQSITPTLRALPRNCLECYFLSPDQLWSCLPKHQPDRFADGKAGIENQLYSVLDHWVVAWCLWRVVRMRQHELHAVLGFPQGVVDRLKAQPNLSETEIKAELRRWHENLEPDAVYRQFVGLRDAVIPLSPSEKLTRHVDGKSMFNEIVVAKILKTLIPNKEAAEWLKSLVAGMTAPPAEMLPILAEFMP